MNYITDYKHNTKYRQSFNNLAFQIFGIYFENWYQAGLWNDSYICYSFAENDQVIANVSATSLECIVNDTVYSAVQIGTVMTHPDYRGRGLAKSLMQKVFDVYKQTDMFYLFPNNSVLEFYKKLGFHSYRDSLYQCNIPVSPAVSDVRKIDMKNHSDINILVKTAGRRTCISQKFAVNNAQSILAWYCVNIYPDSIYYLAGDNAVILCECKDNILHIYDIITTEKTEALPLIKKLGFCAEKIVFYFTPDFPDFPEKSLFSVPNEIFYLKSQCVTLPKIFSHPITAHA